MKSVFDEKASSWDTDERIMRASVVASSIRSAVDVPRNARIMDFGAGTGLVGMNFLDITDNITFIEKSDGMRDVLRAKITAKGISSLQVFEDLADHELRKSPFDLIVNSLVFHHLKDIKATGRELYGLLRDGGSLCIVDLMPDDGSFHANEAGFDGYDGFDPVWLSGQLSECGFTYVSHQVILHAVKRNKKCESAYSLFLLRMDK